jgi:hypothetical protein
MSNVKAYKECVIDNSDGRCLFLFSFLGRGETDSIWYVGTIVPVLDDGDDDEYGAVSGISDREN